MAAQINNMPVMKTVGVVAACWNVREAGMGASIAAGLTTTVPRQPCASPNTASPAPHKTEGKSQHQGDEQPGNHYLTRFTSIHKIA
jgi:hypothetical protein